MIVIVAGSCFWYFQYKKPHDEAVANFNKAVSALKESNKPLDEAVSSLKSVIDSKEEPLDLMSLLNDEPQVESVDDDVYSLKSLNKNSTKTSDFIL